MWHKKIFLPDVSDTAKHLKQLFNHVMISCIHRKILLRGRQGGREGGREGEREGGREGEREAGREGGREEGREGGREGTRGYMAAL